MLCANKLSQHAIGQSEAREVSHTIPACSSLDKLSWHAVSQLQAWKARHLIPACSGSQSQIGKARMLSQHTEQKLTCTKEAAKGQNSRQADTVR